MRYLPTAADSTLLHVDVIDLAGRVPKFRAATTVKGAEQPSARARDDRSRFISFMARTFPASTYRDQPQRMRRRQLPGKDS